MNIDRRIRRRQRGGERLVYSYQPLSPVRHVAEPLGRAVTVEELLDHLAPVFEGRLPPNGYVYGPSGAGKSAVVDRLFDRLHALTGRTRDRLATTTRATPRRVLSFVGVDLRRASSEFAFYRSVLDGLVADSVPRDGISTADLRTRIESVLGESERGAVLAVDHVGEPNAVSAEQFTELVARLPSNVSWLAVGRASPDETRVTDYTARAVRVSAYDAPTLADVVIDRADDALTQGALEYDAARRIAEWAGGDAHDALCALLVACDRAETAARLRVADEDVRAALDAIPRPSVSLGRVCTLPANRRRVVYELAALPDENRTSVRETAERVAASESVDLSVGTVERFLYELAESGVLDRVRVAADGTGRPPSHVELRFSPTVFRRLYES